MADCTITDRYGYWSAGGTFVGIQNALVLAVPDLSSRRYDSGGTYRALGINPNITTAAHQRGRFATTSSTGEYSFALPYGATATLPTTPSAQWSIVLPSGDIWTGVVPSVAGPLTLNDLIVTYSWVANTSVYIAPVTPGTLARGSKTFTASSSESVVFSTVFASSAYNIKLSASVDSVTSNVPGVGWASKTTSGFTIVTSGVFTGTVDFEVVL